MKAKILINKYFNIGQYITTIRETNISFFCRKFVKTSFSLILFQKITKPLTSYLYKNHLGQLFVKFQASHQKRDQTPYYPSWIIFTRSANSNSNYPTVITYINIKLISLYFLIRKDIFNHHNINLIFFFNQDTIYFIINIYLDDYQNALKQLKNIE